MNHTTDGITPVHDGIGTIDHLGILDDGVVDGNGILEMAAAVNGIIHPDTVYNEQYPVGFKPSDYRASSSHLAFLQVNTAAEFQHFGRGLRVLKLDFFSGYFIDGGSDFQGFFLILAGNDVDNRDGLNVDFQVNGVSDVDLRDHKITVARMCKYQGVFFRKPGNIKLPDRIGGGCYLFVDIENKGIGYGFFGFLVENFNGLCKTIDAVQPKDEE